jgi:hypothetical protein
MAERIRRPVARHAIWVSPSIYLDLYQAGSCLKAYAVWQARAARKKRL